MEHSSSTDPRRIAQAARERIPRIVSSIEDLVGQTDPFELLAQLTLLFQTHPENELPNREEASRWQVRIEWLAWLICARRLHAPSTPAVLDGSILTPLEELLEEYFQNVATTLLEPDDLSPPAYRSLRSALKRESLFVRGEGFRQHFERSAIEIYAPHDPWCLEHIGLTIRDALELVSVLAERFSNKLRWARQEGARIKEVLRSDPACALTLRLPAAVRAELERALPASGDEDGFADSIEFVWFFFQATQIVGFTTDELLELTRGEVGREKVEAFLALMSFKPDTIDNAPDPFALSPLARTPLLRSGDRYFLFAPGTLLEGLFYRFHARLFEDRRYRPRYDDSRAAIMEAEAVEAFRRLLPRAERGWRLKYGPRKQRTDLDGLVLYDGKLILIECKWKNLQLISRTGDVDSALGDIDKAILQPLAQAHRARDFISKHGEAEFEDDAGRTILVRSSQVSEVILVTLVGSGAWAQIAANLPSLIPPGFFRNGEYPWALSLNDLRVVSECLQGFPALLFDYLRRRARFQADERFHLHDEWDFLGVYLSGALDVDDSNFPKDMDLIMLDGFDSGLQDYYSSLSQGSTVSVARPQRRLPPGLARVLVDAEIAGGVGRIDSLCLILGWSDSELRRIDEMLTELVKKTRRDGRAHAVAGRHPARAIGIALACGFKNRDAIRTLLHRSIETHHARKGRAEWVGIGLDLAAPYEPFLVHSQPM